MWKSNIFIFIVFCAIDVLAEWPPAEIQEILDPLHETCTKKIGLSDDEVKNYKISDNSPKFMCYMKCLLVEYNWMSTDDVIDYDRMEKTVVPSMKEIYLNALKGCKTIPESSVECEKAYKFMHCLHDADTAHWFLP